MLKIKKEEDLWNLCREEEVLDQELYRDLAFLAACNHAEDGEEIEVYKESGELEFTFIIDDCSLSV